MTLSEAIKTIRDYCAAHSCYECPFAEEGTFITLCGLIRHTPRVWIDPPETNIYDEEEIHKSERTGETRNLLSSTTGKSYRKESRQNPGHGK